MSDARSRLGAATAQASAQAAADGSVATATARSSFSDLLNRAALSATAVTPTLAGAGATVGKAGATAATSATASASASASTPTAADPTGADNPLAGLAAILFSGPLQTPPATVQATAEGQAVLTAVQQAAPTASADTLASWKSQLSALTQQLNQVEKSATGVDPTAAPVGWTEPANFVAARTLLTTLQANVTQAQAALGVTTLAADASATQPTLTALGLQAAGLRFLPAQPQGQSAAKLVGSAGEGAKSKASVAPSEAAPPSTAVAGKAAPVAQAAGSGETSRDPASGDEKPPEPSIAPVQADSIVSGTKTASSAQVAAQTQAGVASITGHAQATAKTAADTPSTATALAQAQAQADTADALAASSAGASDAGQATPLAAQVAGQGAAQNPVSTAAQTAPAAVAMLGAEIVKQAKGRATSFNIELHPADLGKVDVKLQIQADGSLAARMAFDNPAAAAQFQAQADELRSSLQQAGFQVGGDALSFTSNGGQSQGGGADSGGSGGSGQSAARAFADAQAASVAADLPSDPFQARQAIGLDLRI